MTVISINKEDGSFSRRRASCKEHGGRAPAETNPRRVRKSGSDSRTLGSSGNIS